ncbi:MAG: HAMP domain-containing protein [Gammaproteobacteria bacterium]|nr:HAMP domain-containing protein [Gammaproteobacteria bacterium]
MTRLYLRIFLGFWLVIALTLAVTVAVNRSSSRAEVDRERVATLRSSLDALAAQAQQVLTADGVPGLRLWLATEIRERPEPLLLVIGPNDRELLDRPLPPGPPRMVESLRRLAEGGPGPHRRMPVRVLQASSGERYLLFVPLREIRGARWLINAEFRRNFFIVALLISGGICFLLARYLTRPIRALRRAGQQLAGGDLNVRVLPAVAARGDELGALARDFDHMVERLQELVGSQQRLLRDVSHELRSPLTRLQTAVGLIRQRRGDAPDPDLDRIQRETERLDSLIGQILSFSRLQVQSGVTRGPVDLAELLHDIVDDANFEGQARGTQVVLDDAHATAVEGDERLLRSAVENVVRNALVHAIRLVRVGVTTDSNRQVVITVTDDGPGVTDTELPRLFEPFYQSPASRSRGAGLGLAIAARAVALHGGSMAAQNLPAGGLAVALCLPQG